MLDTSKWHVWNGPYGWRLRKVNESSGSTHTVGGCKTAIEAVAILDRWHDNGTCVECGDVLYDGYYEPTKSDIINRQLCFGCLFWTDLINVLDDPSTVRVEGRHYRVERDRPHSPSSCLGFGGSRFHIRFHDGRVIVSHNLWTQGVIPDRFRERLPDNAVFVHTTEAPDAD